jgi:hypothetical protein
MTTDNVQKSAAHSTAGPYTRTSIKSNILAVILCFQIGGTVPNYIRFADAHDKMNVDAPIIGELAKLTSPCHMATRTCYRVSCHVDPVLSPRCWYCAGDSLKPPHARYRNSG